MDEGAASSAPAPDVGRAADPRRQRRAVWVLLACAVLVGLGLLLTDARGLQSTVARQLARHGLVEIAASAGVRGPNGTLVGGEPLAVELVQEGGPVWLREALMEALEDDPAFVAGDSRHLVRVEVAAGGDVLAFHIHLLRGGWALRTSEPLRMWLRPWVFAVAGLLGALLAFAVRRIWVGLAVAGVVAQGLLASMAWPEPLRPQRLLDAWQTGPFSRAVVTAAGALSDLGNAVAIGAVVMCVILIVLEQRRSDGGEESVGLLPLTLATLAGFLGAVAWVEAGLRAAAGPWLGTAGGMFAALGIAVAFVMALRRARERWHA